MQIVKSIQNKDKMDKIGEKNLLVSFDYDGEGVMTKQEYPPIWWRFSFLPYKNKVRAETC